MAQLSTQDRLEWEKELVESARYGDVEGLMEASSMLGQSLQELATFPAGMNGATALHMAAANGHERVLELLLKDSSCNLNSVVNAEGSSPLHWAALNGHLAIVKLLLKYGASPTLKNASGKSPLSLAESREMTEVVQELLKCFEPDNEDDEDTPTLTPEQEALLNDPNVKITFADESEEQSQVKSSIEE